MGIHRGYRWTRLLQGRTETGLLRKAEWIDDSVVFARERLDFTPDEKQELVLRGGRRGIVNCCRQWGKSTVAAAKAVHRAFTRPGCVVLVIAPTLRQSGEFLMKAEEFARRLGIKDKGDGK